MAASITLRSFAPSPARARGRAEWVMVGRMLRREADESSAPSTPALPRRGSPTPSQRSEAMAVERALVERAQAGDRVAMGELLRSHLQPLYATVLLPRLGSEAAAKDALAETCAKVVERIDRFRWQNVGFYPWLRTVALRVAIDMLRARKRTVLWEADDVARELDASQTTTPLEQAVQERRDRDAARARVDAALGKINERYARAIRMRVIEERPRDEVAAELGVTLATFDVLLHRATSALRKALEEDPAHDP